jgi:hypothetical protein
MPSCKVNALVQVACGHCSRSAVAQCVTIPVGLLSAAEDKVDLFAACHLGNHIADGDHIQKTL